MSGVWVELVIPTADAGDILMSVRIDQALDPAAVCAKLDKEADGINKDFEKVMARLAKFNEKTPRTAVEESTALMLALHRQYMNNIRESDKWFGIWADRLVSGSP